MRSREKEAWMMQRGRCIVSGEDRVAAEAVKPRMLPSGEKPDHLLGHLSSGKKSPERLVPEEVIQFSRKGRILQRQ
jgi:hypothetical protein